MIEIDYNMSLIELQKYTDEELYQVLNCANQDKNEIFRAECTYWMQIPHEWRSHSASSGVIIPQ